MTLPLNRRLTDNPPSGIRRIGQLAARIPDCIALTIGEPDFDAPIAAVSYTHLTLPTNSRV